MISSTLAYTFSPQNLHYYCIIAWAKMCIFVQKCAKLCIADDFVMSDKECSWNIKGWKPAFWKRRERDPTRLLSPIAL